MRPMERRETGQRDLFRARLDQIVDLDHPLVKLVRAIDWGFLEERCGAVYTDGPGRPPLPTRLMAGLAILKHMHDLSDEVLCERWLENPYDQLFCGEELFQHKLPFVLAHALAPAGQRRAIKRQFVLEELLTAEQLIIRVLKPALAQDLVGEVMHVLEDGQAGHQPRRQRRASRTVRVDRPTPLLEKAPVDRPYELHERVIKVDDLVEPGSEEITLPRLPTLHWPHESPRRRLEETRESRPERRINLQESQSTTRQNRQARILPVSRSSRKIKALGVLHGRLIDMGLLLRPTSEFVTG